MRLLSPLDAAAPAHRETLQAADEVWAELERLGAEIGRKWRSPKSSTELLSEMRR